MYDNGRTDSIPFDLVVAVAAAAAAAAADFPHFFCLSLMAGTNDQISDKPNRTQREEMIRIHHKLGNDSVYFCPIISNCIYAMYLPS